MKRILLACAAALLAVSSFTAAPASAAKPASKGAAQRISRERHGQGLRARETLPVKAGKPIVLVVTRKTDRTCATEVVMKSPAINVPLPLNKPVEIKLGAQKPVCCASRARWT